MIPLKYEDHRKRMEAMVAAFIERFMISFLIPNISLGIHSAVTGLLLGVWLKPSIGNHYEGLPAEHRDQGSWRIDYWVYCWIKKLATKPNGDYN